MEQTIQIGDKTIKFTLYFWTDGFKPHGITDPKAAWSCGTLVVKSNKSRGIPSTKQYHFHRFSEIQDAILKAANEAGVTIYKSERENLN